ELVRDTCQSYAQRGEHVRCLSAPTSLPIVGRPLALRRALSNLIDNGLKYAGGDIEIVLETDSDPAVLHVLDRGPGIAPHETERLLQPFTRTDNARGGASGSGLGLAIVQRIAAAHGGAVRLLPRSGGGLDARLELAFGLER
ncbi:MAG TPA: ATP-binding protein, partial [Burkholderiales bacterium]|nr:ATP-binding protein [Burkholderiales bacterium]